MPTSQGEGQSPRRRGPAIGKHRRGATNPHETARRKTFGAEWGPALSLMGKRLRETGRAA